MLVTSFRSVVTQDPRMMIHHRHNLRDRLTSDRQTKNNDPIKSFHFCAHHHE
jgi:hypothetical protein